MADKKVVVKAIKHLKYEEAAAELDQIVDQLEEGQLSLEDTLVLYERGQLLIQTLHRVIKSGRVEDSHSDWRYPTQYPIA